MKSNNPHQRNILRIITVHRKNLEPELTALD